MKSHVEHLRVATYNVHKCRGMDRKTSPGRIARILQGLDADVIGVQEILDVRNGPAELDQVRQLADSLPGYAWCVGENRTLHGGAYGNMTLSRLPIESFHNYDLSHLRREPRGCLRADVKLDALTTVHAFNLHLGTSFFERRHQGRALLDLLEDGVWSQPRVIFGDFNEWTRGLATRNMSRAFNTFEPRIMLKKASSYPGFLPILHLDHFYYDASLHLERIHLVKSNEARLASDHLPLVADFSLVSPSKEITTR
jgi:endonuclease/exonuclease/phosphatase family metal-dependent hydrolase